MVKVGSRLTRAGIITDRLLIGIFSFYFVFGLRSLLFVSVLLFGVLYSQFIQL